MSDATDPRRRGEIRGLLRVRNEADLLEDTLEHMAAFCDGGIWVYDDASDDGSADLCTRHPAVREVLRGEVWDRDRERAEHQNRQAVLEAARRTAGPDDWFVYLDADERVEFDWERLHHYPQDVLAVRMKLFDFYITADDVARPYTERRFVGPEYRNILIAYRNRPGMKYCHPDQREVALAFPGRIVYEGAVRHYGKALSVERWERKCDYYAESFPKYAVKWAARRGKAVHDRSDFGKPLVDWDRRGDAAFPLALRPDVRADASEGGPLRVLLTNHQLVHPSGSETFTLTLARHRSSSGR